MTTWRELSRNISFTGGHWATTATTTHVGNVFYWGEHPMDRAVESFRYLASVVVELERSLEATRDA